MNMEKIKQIGNYPFYSVDTDGVYQIISGDALMVNIDFKSHEEAETYITNLFPNEDQLVILTNFILTLIDNFEKIKNFKK